MQTLLRCPYSLRVQSHASTSVGTLKIPSTVSHTIVRTDGNTARINRNGSAALAAAVHYPGKATRISRKGQRSTKNQIHLYIYDPYHIYIYIFVGISQADRAGLDKALKGEILE